MLVLLPFLHQSKTRVSMFKPINHYLVLSFIATVVILTYLGNCPLEAPYVIVGQMATMAYFGLLGLICFVEDRIFLPYAKLLYNV